MQTLIKTCYPPIPEEVVKAVIKSEVEEQQESSPTISSEKALVTAIFPSTDPVVLNYDLKEKSVERTDEDYISIGDESDVDELLYRNCTNMERHGEVEEKRSRLV